MMWKIYEGGIMDLEKKFKNIGEIEKEIGKLDEMMGYLKGWVEEIRKNAELYFEYDELKRALGDTISKVRKLRNILFRILGEAVYMKKHEK